jgi:hypothetical protein
LSPPESRYSGGERLVTGFAEFGIHLFLPISKQAEIFPPAFFASAAAKAIMGRGCLRRSYLDRLSTVYTGLAIGVRSKERIHRTSIERIGADLFWFYPR